ncbi:hypothetical protein BRC2024_KCUCJSVR_CDS_0013 [Acinetobacter phage vB_AbaM_KissB]
MVALINSLVCISNIIHIPVYIISCPHPLVNNYYFI